MKVEQVAQLTNGALKETRGETTEILTEDLSNVVQIGKALLTDVQGTENFANTLVDRIGKVVVVDRLYTPSDLGIKRDSWDYGSILQKIDSDEVSFENDESWELKDGKEYNQDVFNKPKVRQLFFNNKVSEQIKMSITRMQLQSAFTSAEKLNAFVTMLFNKVANGMSLRDEIRSRETVSHLVASVMHENYPDGKFTDSKAQAINLLKDYNTTFGQTLTKDRIFTTPEFIRYASYRISEAQDYMASMSTLYNVGGRSRFTPKSEQILIMLSPLKNAAKIYLESDTYHKDLVSLPNFHTIPFFQMSGANHGLDDISHIKVKIATKDKTPVEVDVTGVIGILFDKEACGITSEDPRTTSHYNARAEFTNYWFKVTSSYFNDLNENAIVFYVA